MPAEGARPGAVRLNIRDKAILYAAYMPWVRGGGLFVPTARAYALGEEMVMLITLLDDPAQHAVAGTVVWITPSGAPNRVQGVGVQFREDETGTQVRGRIEQLLTGQLQAQRPTHTM